MAAYRTNRSTVQWVSGNAIIPTYRQVTSLNHGCVTILCDHSIRPGMYKQWISSIHV